MNQIIKIDKLKDYIKQLKTTELFVSKNSKSKLDPTVLASLYKHLVSKMPNWNDLEQVSKPIKSINSKDVGEYINSANIETNDYSLLDQNFDDLINGKNNSLDCCRLAIYKYHNCPALYLVIHKTKDRDSGSDDNLPKNWSIKNVHKHFKNTAFALRNWKYYARKILGVTSIGLLALDAFSFLGSIFSFNIVNCIFNLGFGGLCACGIFLLKGQKTYSKFLFSKKLASKDVFLKVVKSALINSLYLSDAIEHYNKRIDKATHYSQYTKKHLEELSNGNYNWKSAEREAQRDLA